MPDVPDMRTMAQQKFLETLDVIELFLMSFCSETVKTIIKSMIMEPQKIGVFVKGRKGFMEVIVHSNCSIESKLIFTCAPLPSSDMKKQPKMTIDIDGCILKLRIFKNEPNKTTVYLNKKYKNAMYSVLVKYICDLFNENVQGSILPKLKKSIDIGACTTMILGNEKDSKAKDLDEFLHRNPVQNALILTNKVKGFLPVDSPLYRVNNLFITRGGTLDSLDLMNFRGLHALISETKMTMVDVMEFLDSWKFGYPRRLETMIVYTKREFDINDDDLKQRYGARPWNRKQRARRYQYSAEMRTVMLETNFETIFDCAQGYDIQREDDGLLATIKFSTNYFFFFVWHNRFPIYNPNV